ncbi:hypothetical protein [Mesomycoplasma neurolyticum]|uniref:Uncharacterized protein n=1 Tax=Mesomycoplasma neurolyticum TaxID=2120 RepID=A0A449A5W8_9BACT|nr:hypothetical protein [Mesomycoplasma neurolyticum]VEU59553.1 Uncharacterised protein [Mesomycoplasma neurolyticum]
MIKVITQVISGIITKVIKGKPIHVKVKLKPSEIDEIIHKIKNIKSYFLLLMANFTAKINAIILNIKNINKKTNCFIHNQNCSIAFSGSIFWLSFLGIKNSNIAKNKRMIIKIVKIIFNFWIFFVISSISNFLFIK